MSTVYDKTDNYALNLYGDNDPADLRDGYNGSMRTIDATLETHLNRIEGVEARETHDEEVVKALLGDNTVDSATAAKNKYDKAVTDAATANGKADVNTTILDALGADTTGNAAANKTKWDKTGTDLATLKDDFTAYQASQKRVALYIGNSYTHGVGSSGGQTGLYAKTKFLFNESSEIWGDGIGFVPYAGHTETFASIYQDYATQHSADCAKVTDIIITSAYGDTRAYIASGNLGTYRQNLIAAVNSFIALVRQYSPMARIWVDYAEGTSAEGKGGVTLRKEFELDIIFETAFNQVSSKDIVYLGWVGWNITHHQNAFSGDGYHPNDHGYDFLASSFVQAWRGNAYEYDKSGTIAFSAESGGTLSGNINLATRKNASYWRFRTIRATAEYELAANTEIIDFTSVETMPPIKHDTPILFANIVNTQAGQNTVVGLVSLAFDETGTKLVMSPVGKPNLTIPASTSLVLVPFSTTVMHSLTVD